MMKLLLSYVYKQSHNHPIFENRELDQPGLLNYKDIQRLEQEIAKEKSNENVGAPQVTILCCSLIAG